MATERARLLLHPVRMRVLVALGSRDLTTRQMQAMMSDVPQASLYRAIAKLSQAGVIGVVKTEQRGGATERTYHVSPQETTVSSADLASSAPDEILAITQTFGDLLTATMGRHIARAGDDWSKFRFLMRQESLWLTDAEREELADELFAVIDKYVELQRRPGTQLYSLQTSVLPDVDPADSAQ